MVKSRVVVYTDKYKFAHGKCPRGYREWHFEYKDKAGKKHEFNYLGMYKEAKVKAIECTCEHDSCVLTLLT